MAATAVLVVVVTLSASRHCKAHVASIVLTTLRDVQHAFGMLCTRHVLVLNGGAPALCKCLGDACAVCSVRCSRCAVVYATPIWWQQGGFSRIPCMPAGTQDCTILHGFTLVRKASKE